MYTKYCIKLLSGSACKSTNQSRASYPVWGLDIVCCSSNGATRSCTIEIGSTTLNSWIGAAGPETEVRIGPKGLICVAKMNFVLDLGPIPKISHYVYASILKYRHAPVLAGVLFWTPPGIFQASALAPTLWCGLRLPHQHWWCSTDAMMLHP